MIGIVTALLLLFPALGETAQGVQTVLDSYIELDLEEVPERYREWVTEEVGVLITEEELEVFLRLDSEAKYERFIEDFWRVRDPTPGTPANEYRELHYERLAYVNKFYGRSTSKEGWETDRGQTYLLLGEPVSISSVPSEMLVHPTEVWFYAADPELGLPAFFYLLFFQEHGAGEFELYSPLSDGPRELLNGAGIREIDQRRDDVRRRSRGFAPSGFDRDADVIHEILLEVDFDLASAAFSYMPSEAGLEFGITPLSSEMLIADLYSVPEKLSPDPTWAYNVLTGVTESDVRFETLEVSASAVPLIDVDGEPVLHFATRTVGEQLNLGNYEDEYYFSFEASGSIVDDESRVLQNYEANMSGDLDAEQARRFASNPFIYMDLLPTLPGRQRFSLMLENTVAGSFGRGELEVDVPRAHPPRPEIAGPVLAHDVREREFDPFGARFPFQYRDRVMVPSVDRAFDVGQVMHVFCQVLLPTAFDGPVTLRYVLDGPGGRAVREDAVTLAATEADEHGVLANTWSIRTEGLEPGEYRLVLSLDENEAASRTRTLQLRPTPDEPGRPFINAQPAPPAADVEMALERARMHRVVGEFDAAIGWLEYARQREPTDPDVQRRYVDLLEQTGSYDKLIEVLTPIVAADPENADALLRLARAHARGGEHYDAIRYYERARLVLDEEDPQILNSLAAEYHGEGRVDKAREILSLSLELDADQPEVRRMLERISEAEVETSR